MMSSNQAFPKVKGPMSTQSYSVYVLTRLKVLCYKGHKLFLSPRRGNLSLYNFDYLSG